VGTRLGTRAVSGAVSGAGGVRGGVGEDTVGGAQSALRAYWLQHTPEANGAFRTTQESMMQQECNDKSTLSYF
jgi:hypothetical protein